MIKTARQRQLSWDNFRSSILVKGEERVHRVADAPIIEIFADGSRNCIGLWLEVPESTAIPDDLLKLAFIRTRIVTRTGKKKTVTLLELAVSAASLYRQFYHFAIATAERVLVERKPSIEAVQLEMQGFAELLAETPLLGIERQIGLLGELLVLERLVMNGGPPALDSWIGPLHEPHDFRLGRSEYEVKTTICTQRIHTIHGAEQLVPTKGCKLFLLSVLLGPAGKGDGFSLAGKVQRLSALLEKAHAQANRFQQSLRTCGFREEDSAHYSRLFAIRRPLAVVPVDAKFPAITRKVIQSTLGAALGSRIGGLQYDVDVEGLEAEEGTPGFPSDFREQEPLMTKSPSPSA
jgi:hypothetical protein